MSEVVPRPAATVIVMRPAPSGMEVLLLKRSERMGFFPDAWVFPGGTVDAVDHRVPAVGQVEGLPEERRAFGVAAIRECYEESGVWLGSGEPPTDLREALQVGAGALHDHPGLVADLSLLGLWSWWVTPAAQPRRFDTLFFVAVVPEGAIARSDQIETVSHAWVEPRALLEGSFGADCFLAPPTWFSLWELSRFRSPAEVLAAAPARPRGRVTPVRLDSAGVRTEIVLPGDLDHPEPRVLEGPTRLGASGRSWRVLR